MNALQRFCLEGLSSGKITNDDMIEMCRHYLKEDVLEKLMDGLAIEECKKALEEKGYKIIEPENLENDNGN